MNINICSEKMNSLQIASALKSRMREYSVSNKDHQMVEGSRTKQGGIGSRKSLGSRSSKSRSSKSSISSNGSSRSSIKDKAIEEKIKVADLIAESNFTEQKLKMEYEAKRLELE